MNLYRIILVDDEEEVRKGIIRKIDWETLGFQVVGDAENGQDALEKIEQLEPDVVMTDIRMPYMDCLLYTSGGKQLIRRCPVFRYQEPVSEGGIT